MPVKISPFGTYLGNQVLKVALVNNLGTIAEFLTFGATWHSFIIADKKGIHTDVIIGPKMLEGYKDQFDNLPYFFGSTVGRHAGRVHCEGEHPFLQKHLLTHKNGIQLHGGEKGFAKKNWSIEQVEEGAEPSVTFFYKSNDGEEGYPGELATKVTYSLSSGNAITIDYQAVSNKDTIVNLTNHAYFNLGETKLIGHSLNIACDTRLELGADLLPTGKFLDVVGTPYDFTTYKELHRSSLKVNLDDVFILKKSPFDVAKIKLLAPATGIELQVFTDQPAVVVFAPKRLNFSGTPKNNGIDYEDYSAICFETQFPPDAINNSSFPSCELKKGETYTQRTIYSFGINTNFG